jgi:hypothetical protein
VQPVEDTDGRRYLLVKRSGESSLVRDPTTGSEAYLPNEELSSVEASGLELAAEAVPAPVRRVLRAVHNDRAPTSVRDLLDRTDLCESDLHGLLGEFRAAGLVVEADVLGERGYETTDVASEGLDLLREDEARE